LIRLSLLAFFILSLFLFSSCTTFSKKDCEKKSWYQVGYDSGFNGEIPGESYQYYKRECGEVHHVEPDSKAFDNGYNTGIRYFCTPSRGLSFGRAGGSYAGVCPRELEEAFLAKYQLGRIEYTGNRLEGLEREVGELKSELQQKDQRIKDLEERLKDPKY
jgi:hypothetical protein